MTRTSCLTAILGGIVLCLAGCKSHEGHGHEHDGDTSSASHAENRSGHEDHGQTEPEPGDAGHGQTGHDPMSHGSDLQLSLNDGAKWPVDDSTRESAARLASLVAGTESVQTVESAQALGKALDEELDTLVKGCKMTGPAHDQLHVFLVALFPQVEALKEKTEVADLQLARKEVGDLLEAYSHHFE